ncbi:nonribosomal peptide synthase [Penicillium hispanicum]|uniref:nonribosomal peptide synthase n=1 Tax=Penicillium hispanicum TaxID=1080232 RepID=UPI0025408F63|nr:nonribosomal peptide synthase [Penicillium hispanicum]KAJ5583989.1 nonribosomal peptide synthase [Penicillium hispanicum]
MSTQIRRRPSAPDAPSFKESLVLTTSQCKHCIPNAASDLSELNDMRNSLSPDVHSDGESTTPCHSHPTCRFQTSKSVCTRRSVPLPPVSPEDQTLGLLLSWAISANDSEKGFQCGVIGALENGQLVPIENDSQYPVLGTMELLLDPQLNVLESLEKIRQTIASYASMEETERLRIGRRHLRTIVVLQQGDFDPTVTEQAWFNELCPGQRSERPERLTFVNWATKDRLSTIDINMQSNSLDKSDLEQCIEGLIRALGATCHPGTIVQSLMPQTDASAIESTLSEGSEHSGFWNTCVHNVIQARCREAPESMAVFAWDGALSYGELDDLSTRLALALTLMGIKPESIVPICMDKSRWTTVAILAVMKSGGAFTLLDPSYPQSRLEIICQDIACRFILTSEQRSEMCSSLATPLVVEHLVRVCRPPPEQPIASAVMPENALYVAFTSGSTGKPKGVIIEHRSYCSGARQHLKAFGITRGSNVLQFATYAFDVSLMETLSTLMAGACLCVVNNAQRTDPVLFAEAFESFQITHALLTPSFARTIPWPQRAPGTTSLILGGEMMRPSDPAMYASLGIRLMNAYGPAECSVNASALTDILPGMLPNNIGFGTGAVPWIVDPENPEREVPPGSIGELLIEGPIVGRGYLHNPEATRRAFIDIPPWLQTVRAGSSYQHRVYLTGDLASKDPSTGTLFIHGRKDHQVKIRGQRVELGEIEHHLHQSLSLKGTEVLVEKLPSVDERQERLVAFIIFPPSDVGTPSADGLFLPADHTDKEHFCSGHRQLKAKLPSYMVPDIFFPLATVPRVPSGKVDRGLLRAAAASLPSTQLREYNVASLDTNDQRVPPKTPRETQVRNLYAEVLRMPPELIGMSDTFLQLGGDSLLAIRVVGQARQSGLLLSIQDIMSSKVSLAEQAARAVTNKEATQAPTNAVSDILNSETGNEVTRLAADQHSIRPEEIEDCYPCTALQEGMFAASIKHPGKYTGSMVMQVHERVDPAQLKSAWHAITLANPILRTRIISTTKGFMQVVLKDQFVWKETDGLESDFVASGGSPLVQFEYCPGDCQLTLTLHHSIWDGWSLHLVLRQFEDAYRDIRLRKSSFYPFIQHTQSLQDVDTFWSSELADLDAPIFPILPSSTYQPSPTTALQHLVCSLNTAGSTEHTVATYIHLAWSLLVAHYTDSSDVLYGLTVSGRNAPIPDIETLVGPTIATIPFRVRKNSNLSVHTALDQIQDSLTRAIPHEQAGLQRISKCSPDAARACDFQTQIIVEAAATHDDVESSLLGVSRGSTSSSMSYASFTNCALMIVFHPSRDKETIRIDATFDPQVMSSKEVDRMMYQFEHILRQLYEKPSRKTGDLQMASPGDLRQLQMWNRDMPQADRRCLQDLVLAQATRRPQSTAVASWDGSLTYEALISRSAHLSNLLALRGVSPGSFVSICLERSKWSVVAIIAVLLAGGTCILLDLNHPRQRMQQIAQHASSQIMINSDVTLAVTSGICPTEIRLTPSMFESVQEPPSVEFPTVSSEQPAFLMFTSGSTGQPKGIIMPHRTLSTSIYHHSDGMKIHPGTRALHFSSYAFDVSIYEIFTTLAAGGTICVPSEFERKNSLADFIRRMEVNWAFLTPTTVQTLLPSEVPSLTTLVLGGEAVTRDNAETWARGRSLINGYGPAEATICGVGPISEHGWKSGVIGHIVGGLGWVTEPTDPTRLAAVGAIGELLLEGSFLARGYLNLPQVTAAAFIEPPAWRQQMSADSHPPMYRTGDLVQYQDDGSIRYMGRRDTRIKLRGQLVDLGEVETAMLRTFPGAFEVVAEVLKLNATANSTVLVTWIKVGESPSQHGSTAQGKYLSPADPSFRDSAALAQTQLKALVPSYMVPSLLLPVCEMPRTLTGKADRRSLRAEIQELPPHEVQSYMVAPRRKEPVRNEHEKRLQEMWADLLQLSPDTIGREDGFLVSGGDSVMAMKMVAMARRAGFVFTVTDVLDNRPLSELAASSTPKALDEIESGGTTTPSHTSCIPSVPTDGHSAVAHHDKKNSVGDSEQPIVLSQHNGLLEWPATEAQEFLLQRYPWSYFRFSFSGTISEDRLHQACKELTQAYSILRTAFERRDGTVRQVVRPDTEEIPFRTIMTDEPLESFCASLCENELRLPVTGTGQATSFMLVSNPDLVRHQFIVRLAHAQYDAASIPRMMGDLEAAYNQSGRVVASNFQDHLFVLSQQGQQAGCAFWKSYLDGSSMTALPLSLTRIRATPDHRPDFPVIIAGTHSLPLPTIPTGVTIATVVKAASGLALARMTGNHDIVLGQTVSGRSVAVDHIDQVVGPCTNYIPYRVTVKSTMTGLEYLRHAQAQHTRCLKYETLGLSQIVQNCTPWPNNTPFSFIVQHQLADTHLTLSLGENQSCSFSLSGRLNPLNEVWICSTPSLHDLKIDVFAARSSLGPESAQFLAREVRVAVQDLLTGLDEPVFADSWLDK